MKKNLIAGSIAGLLLSSLSLAKEEDIGEDGYNKTYNDDSKSFKDRMKDARSTPVVTASNSKGGFTLGLMGDFGPVYDAEPQSSSGMGFGLGITPGFIIQDESWSRIELGLELAYHSFSWKAGPGVTATIAPLSFVPQVGIGHSLGGNLFGVFRVGFGMATGKVDYKASGASIHTDSKMGFLVSGSYDVAYGADKSQFFGGLGVTHYKYTFSEITSGSTTVTVDDGNLNLNHINLHIGARFKF